MGQETVERVISARSSASSNERAAPPAQRAALAQRLERIAHRLGLRYAGAARKDHPCHALCHRLLRHQGELFAFVRVDGLSSR